MNKKLKKTLLVSLLGFWSMASVGCVAVAVGAAAAGGTVAYVRGDLEANYESTLEQVHEASVAAINHLGFSLISDRGDRTGGDIIARTAEDRRIQLTIRPLGDQLTQARIRVGTFGDQELSMRLHKEIRQRL
jgi:hypothetical protein